MYPIVFVHGICPFDRVYMPLISRFHKGDRFAYFKGLKSFLIEYGYQVFMPQISWGGSLEKRATDLYRQLLLLSENFKKYDKVHLIGHSMGGLDIRYMAYKFDLSDKIKSITTIGTPHRGTFIADLKVYKYIPLIKTLKGLGLDITGFLDLTTDSVKELNRILERYESKTGLYIRTIAGKQPYENTFFLLRDSFRLIEDREGENDGLVSVQSAIYKDSLVYDIWDLDHLNQIGWWDPSEPLKRFEFYEKVKGLYLKLLKDLPE